jgi:transposase-like protein
VIEDEAALAEVRGAEDRDHACLALGALVKQYGAKFPKAAAKLTDDERICWPFTTTPAEHWIHLRAMNPIESTFSTVRLGTKVTRGAASRAAALVMTFKLIEPAQNRWRSVNAPHLVALVRAGARFERGVLVERDEAVAA